MTMSKRRRATVAGTCTAALLAAGVAATLLVATPGERSDAATTSASAAQHATTAVQRGSLTEEKTFSGTLGYGEPRPLAPAGSGTVTWLPGYGQVIHRDEVLYRIDEKPVRAMHGAVPMYRALERGAKGQDVRQLNQNLAALGYDVPQDDTFGAKTTTAVRKYQKDRGMTVTGRLDAADIAFVDGDVRVAELTGRVGSPAGESVLGYTSTARVVTAKVPKADAARFQSGSTVSIGFSGASERVPGTVESIDARGDDSGDDANTVTVTIGLQGALPEGVAESAGADVVTTGISKDDVLSVPVNALLPGSGNGYVVEKVTASGATKRVPVQLGFAAQGRVEISGAGIAAGDQVVVPS